MNFIPLVGAAGFEPATSWSQTRRDDRTTLRPELIIFISIISESFFENESAKVIKKSTYTIFKFSFSLFSYIDECFRKTN